jgi:PAS domain S-box-containing protein
VALTGEPLHMEGYSTDLGRWYNVIAYRTEPGHFAVVFTDSTERKRFEETLRLSEQRYRELVQNANSAIIRWTCDGTITFFNEYAQEFFGWRSEEAVGQHVGILVPEKESTGVDLTVLTQAIVEHPERYIHNINENVCRDGRRVWMTWTNRAIRDERGGVIEILAIGTDITELRQAEEALKKLNQTLEQRVAERTALGEARSRQLQALAVQLIEAEERERRRLAQLLHDDLQQILAATRMQLEAACEELPHEPMLENVGRLLEESIDTSRRLSHELSPAVLHHSGLIPALAWLGGQFKDKFGLQVQLESDTAEQFEDSPLKPFLFRAVRELLFNVIKHAGVKCARVNLSASDGRLCIAVSDKGLGFDPEVLDFHDETTGFGLMSIRERARYAGGDLVIESRPEKGSRFTLTVPVRMAGPDDPQRRAADRLAQYRPEGDAAGIRVLFVDDHHVMRQGLINLMKALPGIQVAGEAANGREAIERVRQLKPDLVLMDISMPEMDGIEATRRIKAELPTVRIVGLSVHEDDPLAEAMRAAGAEALVSKTAPSSLLLRTIFGASAGEKG